MSKFFRSVFYILSWVIGLGLILNFFYSQTKTFWTVIYSIFLSITLIPPVAKWFFKKLKIRYVWSKVLISAVFLCLLIYSSPSQSPVLTSKVRTAPSKAPILELNSKDIYNVVRVIDGDTIEVQKDNIKSTIRLIGVDTPELLDPRKPVQCFAKEASEKTKISLTGKEVYLEFDSSQGDKDKYDRLLRYVILVDGTNFNKTLLLDGYAHEYTYNLPYKYQKEFQEAENIARITKKGLWHENACLIVSVTPTPMLISNEKYACEMKKTSCSEMDSCNEAMFYLKTCGVSRLDGNGDGIPCENICK